MAGIAGIAKPGAHAQVMQMLQRISYRGQAGLAVFGGKNSTIGIVWGDQPITRYMQSATSSLWVRDQTALNGFALGGEIDGELMISRDPIGIAPLYYGFDVKGHLCFASEMKALRVTARQIHELPPGFCFDGSKLRKVRSKPRKRFFERSLQHATTKLRDLLVEEIQRILNEETIGCWLSGGLNSSVLAALARPDSQNLHTFTLGLEGSPDLAAAQQVAAYLQTNHHQMTIQSRQIPNMLHEVIYHLESFDPYLVRSGLLSYSASRLAADYAPVVLTGDGADELFGGYESLKRYDPAYLPQVLRYLAQLLHNTKLQRVDRCASAFGLTPFMVFLSPVIVNYSRQIPVEYLIHNGSGKWILRQAMEGLLPEEILNRKKGKAWEGGRIGEWMSRYAEEMISDTDFHHERILASGWQIQSKEELLYYQVFRDCFGEMNNLSWMAQAKGIQFR